jgi:hypothetical protein
MSTKLRRFEDQLGAFNDLKAMCDSDREHDRNLEKKIVDGGRAALALALNPPPNEVAEECEAILLRNAGLASWMTRSNLTVEWQRAQRRLDKETSYADRQWVKMSDNRQKMRSENMDASRMLVVAKFGKRNFLRDFDEEKRVLDRDIQANFRTSKRLIKAGLRVAALRQLLQATTPEEQPFNPPEGLAPSVRANHVMVRNSHSCAAERETSRCC